MDLIDLHALQHRFIREAIAGRVKIPPRLFPVMYHLVMFGMYLPETSDPRLVNELMRYGFPAECVDGFVVLKDSIFNVFGTNETRRRLSISAHYADYEKWTLIHIILLFFVRVPVVVLPDGLKCSRVLQSLARYGYVCGSTKKTTAALDDAGKPYFMKHYEIFFIGVIV